MENLYGIGVTNRYQLFLDEDEDPLEVLKVQEQEKGLKKKSKPSEKENKGKQQEIKPSVGSQKGIKESQNIKSQDQQQKQVKDEKVKQKGVARTSGPDRRFNNENREERNNQRNRPDKPSGPGGDFRKEDRGGERRPERRQGLDEDFRGRGTGRGGFGRGGRRGFDGRGKREFDRQSGSDKTGIKAVDKKEGAGAHNWGSHHDAIENSDNNTWPNDDSWDMMGEKGDSELPPPETTDIEHTEGQNVVDSKEEGDTSANVEEERKELTLDEWKALKGNRSKPTYNLRKAGEGEDLSQWKKMYALTKKKDEEEEEGEEEYDISDYPQRVGRQKHILDIEFTFTDSRLGRGRRGPPRGEPRSPRGESRPPRGEPRGRPRETSSDNAPGSRDIESESGTYGGPRNFRSSGNKSRDRDRERDQNPSSWAQRQQQIRQSAPKVDDELDFPSLG